MAVEVKTGNERMGPAQRDTLAVFNGALATILMADGSPIGVQSRPGFVRTGAKKIVWHGIHTLRVPYERSDDGPFFWDGTRIEADRLAGVLSFTFDPCATSRKLDIDRRHKPQNSADAAQFTIIYDESGVS